MRYTHSRILWFVVVFMIMIGCAPLTPNPEPELPARLFLYDNITMEIQPTYSAGVVTSQLTLLKDSFHKYKICRRENVSTIIRQPVDALSHVWPRNLLLRFRNRHRTLLDRRPNDRHLIVFVSILPGIYALHGHRSTIGLAMNDHHIVLFSNFDRAVLLHEFGHIIGMVDRSKREDPPVNPKRPRHCNNRRCVMFWQVNRDAKFDGLCRRDLAAMIEAVRK
jgi:hypothetical protein